MRKILLVFPVMAFILLPFIVHAQCVQPPTSMVSWWPGDGDANDLVGTNTGTLMNGATFAAGMVSQAFSLDGVDDYVSVPDSPSVNFNPTSPITIDLWAYRTASDTTMHLIAKRLNCGSINFQIAFDPNSGLHFVGDNGGVVTHTDLPLNTWTHLAVTFDGVSTFRFYINGSLTATGSGTLGPVNNFPLTIGKAGSCGYLFKGLIDEVEIFNRALTAEEILVIYNAGSNGKCKVSVTGPCSCYEIKCTNLDSGMIVADHPVVLCFDRETNNGFFNGLCNASGDMSLFFDAMNKEALAYSEDNPYGYLKFHGDWLHVVTGIGYCAGSKWDMRGRKVADENCPENMWPYNPDPGL